MTDVWLYMHFALTGMGWAWGHIPALFTLAWHGVWGQKLAEQSDHGGMRFVCGDFCIWPLVWYLAVWLHE